ncbi:MAG: hypothetical protein C5B43_03665 [Verrucomicrobia bacterium]|nr:MAG: hypothetical protein C5B43_03665 [Verrucomicrobiota bacterium]
MKTTALFLLFFINLICFGEVQFNLHFADEDGTGLKQKGNEWMIKESKKAVKLIGKIIKQNAKLTIKVNATDKTNYAWAPSKHFYTIEEKYGQKIIPKALYKILNNVTTENENLDIDGHIEFNISKFNKEKPEEFRMTFIHELTHILGFLNCQIPTASEIYCYTDFDKLLHDKNGNPLLIHKGDPDGHYSLNPKFDSGIDMYACGPFIRQQNNGNFIKIYNPPVIESGSSYTHLDETMHPRSIMTSHKNSDEYHVWNNVELGVLQELGYEIDWENYYAMFNKVYPATITVNIDKEALEATDTSFEIVANPDFPKECTQNLALNKNQKGKTLTVKMHRECKLVLIDNKTKVRLFTFKPFAKNSLKTILINKKNYKINLTENLLNNKHEFNLKFSS